MLTPEMEEALSNEIGTLRNENKVLKGKIRGYQTLGQLFKELKEKYKILEMNQQKEMVSVATEMIAGPGGPTDKCGTSPHQSLDPKNESLSIKVPKTLIPDITFPPSNARNENPKPLPSLENTENPEMNIHLKKQLENAQQMVEEYERKRSNDKKLVKILNEEIKKTKDELHLTQEKFMNIQQENKLMLMKIKKLEQERDSVQLSIGATATVVGEFEAEDWVHLQEGENNEGVQIQELTQKCNELERKAVKWEREHFNLQREYTKHSAELRCLLEAKSKELVKVTETMTSEKHLLEKKFKKLESMYEAEKKSAFEGQHKYEETFKKYKTLEMKFLSLEQMNKTSSWDPTERRESSPSQMGPTSNSKEQILMLMQQVELFKDDFENERKERIWAQKQQKDFEEKLLIISKQLEKKESELVKCEKSLADEGAKTEKLIHKIKNLESEYKRVNHHNQLLMDMQSKKAETQPVKPKEIFHSPLNSGLSSKIWTCGCCTFINDCQAENCKMCKAPRPASLLASNRPASLLASNRPAPQVRSHLRWKCRTCTYSNNSLLDTCNICATPRNKELEELQWQCNGPQTEHMESNFDDDLDIDGPILPKFL